jgi:hypothetical protein
MKVDLLENSSAIVEHSDTPGEVRVEVSVVEEARNKITIRRPGGRAG